jgi:nucleoid-associated protein YgaU
MVAVMTDRMRMGLALGGLAGLTSLAAIAGGLWWQGQDAQETVRPQPAAVLPAAAPPDMPAARGEGPRFDVARIGARGNAVVAGRAAPGAEVTLHDGERPLGRARADSRGEFVILPAEPLPPGAHALSLRLRDAQGRERQSEESVVVVVPGAGLQEASAATPDPAVETPMAVLLPGTGATPRLLQGPAPAGGQRLGLDIVDYDERGGMRFSGSAPAGGTVRVYVDQHHAGDVTADGAGRWVLKPEPVPVPGRHTLRLDQIGPQGRVAARMELPFQRDAAAAQALAEGRMVVQPGHNLWRIARATYGRGIRFTTIHRANADQIRDPSLIYPGQIFTLPNP